MQRRSVCLLERLVLRRFFRQLHSPAAAFAVPSAPTLRQIDSGNTLHQAWQESQCHRPASCLRAGWPACGSRQFTAVPQETYEQHQQPQQEQQQNMYHQPQPQHSSWGPQQQYAEHPLPAKAYYLGKHLNTTGLAQAASQAKYPVIHLKNGVIISAAARREKNPLREGQCLTGLPLETYLVAYKYGAVVLFNVGNEEKEKQILKLCMPHISDPPRRGTTITDEYKISIVPQMPRHSTLNADRVMLQQLDWSNMSTLAIVLAQSVALDHYAQVAESMLQTFLEYNSSMAKTGDFRDVHKEDLLRMIAKNTIILTDIIVKLGLEERFDVAWRSAQHGQVHEHMRSEFEIEERFEQVRTKLELVQENVKYFLEIMQNKKSVLLEWFIIILIAIEIALGVYDNGLASMSFELLKTLVPGL